MKKLLLTMALTSVVVSTVLAQGTVLWNNGNTSKISTNAVVGGAPVGVTAAWSLANQAANNTYMYALYYSTTVANIGGFETTAVVGTNGIYAFQDVGWNFLNPSAIGGYTVGPAYATNAAAGRFTVEFIDPTHSSTTITPNTTPGEWAVIGWWTGNMYNGNPVTTVSQLIDWYNNGNPVSGGWIGESPLTSGTPGDPTVTPAGTTPSVFGGAFTLGAVPVSVPEPATMALMGLGGLSLLLIRRRK